MARLRPNYVPGDDSFEDNNISDPNAGRPGYRQAEDGSWVPADYWNSDGMGDPNAGRPGYVMAEDGSWVPASFYDSDQAIVW